MADAEPGDYTTPARQVAGMLYFEGPNEDARSEISSFRPISPAHAGMRTIVQASDEQAPAVSVTDTKGHKDLNIDTIVKDTYVQLNVRAQAEAKFNRAIEHTVYLLVLLGSKPINSIF